MIKKSTFSNQVYCAKWQRHSSSERLLNKSDPFFCGRYFNRCKMSVRVRVLVQIRCDVLLKSLNFFRTLRRLFGFTADTVLWDERRLSIQKGIKLKVGSLMLVECAQLAQVCCKRWELWPVIFEESKFATLRKSWSGAVSLALCLGRKCSF